VGLQYRTIRAAASVLLVAAAVGTGGMTSIGSVLAADPPTVALSGTVVDSGGVPLAGLHLMISEELPPDGGAVAVQATTGAGGSFTVDVQAWGTADAPATVTIKTLPGTEVQVAGDTCTQTWGVELLHTANVAWADSAPEPLTLTATTTLLGEVCGTTGTPSNSQSGGGRPALTPPPTDVLARSIVDAPDRIGQALTIGFLLGLIVAAGLLLPRPGARRRD
jgi:hypothetical protein